jgi:TFIIF-interacting CTD phosphatase-like protein
MDRSQQASNTSNEQVTEKKALSNNQEDQVCDSWEQLLESGVSKNTKLTQKFLLDTFSTLKKNNKLYSQYLFL